MTTARTRLLGVIGWPVEHSRSPAIHTAALEALGEDATYLAFAVPPVELSIAIEGLRTLGALGANVTIPHKEHVLPLLDDVEDTARAVGAVNTIVRDGIRLVGANTDAEGLTRALTEAGVALDGRRALVLGAGGAARAAVVGLANAGVSEIIVAARRPPRAERLAQELRAGRRPVRALDLNDGRALSELATNIDLVVQATSATLEGAADPDGFASSLPFDALPDHAAVVDLVYAPRETAVLARARARGLVAVDGLGMLVWQAALALERWLGRPAPIEVMRAAAIAAG